MWKGVNYMGTINSKEDIIDILIKCLPDISHSVNNIMSLTKDYFNEKNSNERKNSISDLTGIEQVLGENQKIIDLIQSNDKIIGRAYTDIHDEELREVLNKYNAAMRSILTAFNYFYSILLGKSDNEEEDIDEFVNSLYTGA